MNYYLIAITTDGIIGKLHIEEKTCTLDEIQHAVGGQFETVPVLGLDDLIMLVNEEGKLSGLPSNLDASALLAFADQIVGTAVIARVDGEEIIGFDDATADELIGIIRSVCRKNLMCEVR